MNERERECLQRQQLFYAEHPDMIDGTCPFAEVPVEVTSTCMTEEACGNCPWWKQFSVKMGFTTEQ